MLTSTKSQAQTAPSSSPHTTVASSCPKHARQRYDVWLWPVKALRSLPLVVSNSLTCESRVDTRSVVPSDEGIAEVTGSARHQHVYDKYPRDLRPMKSERSSPLRRSYVRTCPSTEPAIIVVASTCKVCTASRASSRT